MHLFKKNKKQLPLKFFVSIGAGLNQIPLIDEAKKLGFQVIGVDNNTSAPGLVKCDLKIQESIVNYKDIYTKLRELLIDGDISAVMTKSYGDAITSASFLSERFDLSFIPLNIASMLTNKKKMKAILIDNHILTPEQFSITSRTNITKLDNKKFPMVIKPNIGHAKIGVRYIKSKDELATVLKSYKVNTQLLLEEFIEGDEIIAVGIIHDGVFHLIDITDKVTTDLPYFSDLLHVSPSKHSDHWQHITNIGQTVTDALGITSSPLIMELVVKDQNLYLIEAVPEFGGEFIPDILIPARTGYNFIAESIKSMTNSGFKIPLRKRIKNAVVVKYIIGKEGVLLSCNPDGPANTEGFIFSRIFKEIGSKVNPPKTNLDRIGVVVTMGKTTEEALKNAEKAAENFNIRIQ